MSRNRALLRKSFLVRLFLLSLCGEFVNRENSFGKARGDFCLRYPEQGELCEDGIRRCKGYACGRLICVCSDDEGRREIMLI